MEIEIRNRARQAISHILTAEGMKEVALVVQPKPAHDCCSAGFDVQIVKGEEVSDRGYQLVGERDGWPVYFSSELDSIDSSRLIINLDQASGRLMALVFERE